MAVGEEEKKKGAGKGFAGLSSLVSDVDVSLSPPARQEKTDSGETANVPPNAQAGQRAAQQESDQQASQPSTNSTLAMWLVGFAVLVGLILLIAQGGKQTPSQPAAYEPASQIAYPDKSVEPVVPQEPPRPVEATPPVGQGLALSAPQIRYCLAEDIRLEGARGAVNKRSDTDVDQFNAMVTDYNGRCANYRYKRGALESARRDIEPYRLRLQAEGAGRFSRNPSSNSTQPVAPSPPAPDGTVMAIQSKLNKLGYEAGNADGLMGPSTYSAILAFQRDRGLTADGEPTEELLQLLTAPTPAEQPEVRRPTTSETNAHSANTPSARTSTQTSSHSSVGTALPKNARLTYLGNDWECEKGYYKQANECRAVQIPPNGKLTYLGNDWECEKGYYKTGNECRGVPVPLNGKLTYLGNDWECNRGYFKYGGECRLVSIPQNGKLTYLGNDWECERGYYKNGNECRAVPVPNNGKLTYLGNDWECSRGYFKYGNECRGVQIPPNGKLTYLGNDWECEKGYRKSGAQCVSVFQQ